jgi:hypothetical protein
MEMVRLRSYWFPDQADNGQGFLVKLLALMPDLTSNRDNENMRRSPRALLASDVNHKADLKNATPMSRAERKHNVSQSHGAQTESVMRRSSMVGE